MNNKWLEYKKLHKENENILGGITPGDSVSGQSISSNFPSLLPISMKITAQTIALDLVSVNPMEMKMKPGKSETQLLKEERINKLRKLDGKKPNIELPNDIEVPDLFLPYIDYQYGTGITQNNI